MLPHKTGSRDVCLSHLRGNFALLLNPLAFSFRTGFGGMTKSLYVFAGRIRDGALGAFLARTWRKLVPPIKVWKKIYGVEVCLELRDHLIWWASDPEQIRLTERFHDMLANTK